MHAMVCEEEEEEEEGVEGGSSEGWGDIKERPRDEEIGQRERETTR